jgi:hypothetical protein
MRVVKRGLTLSPKSWVSDSSEWKLSGVSVGPSADKMASHSERLCAMCAPTHEETVEASSRSSCQRV